MLIADRGFCDLWTLAEAKFYGKFAREFFKIATLGWQANNSFKLIKQPKSRDPASEELSNLQNQCYKLILCDKKDEIVSFNSSILVGVVREICYLQARKTGYDKSKVGILTLKECE